MSAKPGGRPDASMTLITEMMQRPLDPGYAAAAESRQESGLPPATSHHGPMLVIFAVLIGALLTTSGMALRAPTTTTSQIKSALVGRIEASRAHADTQTRFIGGLRSEINVIEATALSQQSQNGLAAELARLEIEAGTVSVIGTALVITVDDAPAEIGSKNPNADPQKAAGVDLGKVSDADLQIIVNGLWMAGAEAISVNGHRLTARAAIRSAGEAILVNYRSLVRPYAITAIGDPGSLSVEFADNAGGSYLQSLKVNYGIRGDIQTRDSVVIPGEPALSLLAAKPVQSSVTRQAPATTVGRTPSTTPQQTTETSP